MPSTDFVKLHRAAVRVQQERQWIKQCGENLTGYIARYGRATDADHLGDGAEAIYEADVAALRRAEEELALIAADKAPRRQHFNAGHRPGNCDERCFTPGSKVVIHKGSLEDNREGIVVRVARSGSIVVQHEVPGTTGVRSDFFNVNDLLIKEAK